ncbi:ester hydrolase C11orf54 homolog isoform X2 [Venturia canescens]|nr:ester hydrolase C11orf54 homolog isoform X2 [Venturia canescens]XP_043282030.1 ester hydrolase C11orf54 homolog isoform X2 [Venturia canescens]
MAAALPVESLKIEERILHSPQLEEIKNVFIPALSKNFAECTVEVVDCPDLTKSPFGLADSGLGGKPVILEIGGPAFLLPLVQREKLYDVRPILKRVNYGEKAFVVGAGAGPWPYLSRNAEMIMNVSFGPGNVLKNETRLAWVNQNEKCVLEDSIGSDTRCALLANLYASEGKAGKVLRVHAKKRTGDLDFIATMQKALAAKYTDKLVGMGGAFLLKEGKVHQHVMQDFSKTPIRNVTELNNWLRFYNMSAPLVALGTFVSAETELDLRVQHFHSFGHQGEGGHYHYDTTPETVEYLGYFNVCEKLYRVDQTPEKLKFGKD